MVEKNNRTIDGMAMPRSNRRVVGFDNTMRRAPQAMRKSMQKQRPQAARGAIQRATAKPRRVNITTTEQAGLSKRATECTKLTPNEDFLCPTPTKASLRANEDFLKPLSTLDLDMTSEDLRQRDWNKASKKKKPKKKFLKRILVVFSVILIGGGVFLFVWGDTIISKLTGGQSGLMDLIGAVVNPNVRLATDNNGRTNVLVFGTSGYEMAGSDHDGAQLTDSIMIVSFDQDSKDMAMVSFPRDLYVGSDVACGAGKINEVYWCANQDENNESAGAEALIQTMESITGIDIQYRVHLNWQALVQVVDGIGGITVTLDEDINDYGWTGAVFQAGVPTTINGEQALGLARARHGTEMGDFTRGNSQQKILIAIQDRIVSEGIGLSEGINLINAVGDNVRMNFSVEEIKSLFSLSHEMPLGSMRQIPITGGDEASNFVTTAEINMISYVVPTEGIGQYGELRSYLQRMMSSDEASRENANILVLNGSGEVGVAGIEKEALTELGYQVLADDAPSSDYTAKYTIYQMNNNCPGTAKRLSERYATTPKMANLVPDGIDTTGVDFVIIIGTGQ